MDRLFKVLIIGSDYFTITNDLVKVQSFSWQDLSKIRNIQDHDAVIFDFFHSPDLAALDSQLSARFFTAQHSLEMLEARTTIIILGDPRTLMPSGKEGGMQPFWLRTGFEFQWENASGDIVCVPHDVTPQIAGYLGKLKKWDWAIPAASAKKTPACGMEGHRWRFEQKDLATNKLGNSIAVQFLLLLERADNYGWQRIFQGGLFMLLPRTSMQHEETLQYILQEFLLVALSANEPEWVRKLTAPDEPLLLKKIQEEESVIQIHAKRLDQLRLERDNERRILKLLYEIGEPLEMVIRETFTKLGAIVKTADQRGKADGFLYLQIENQEYNGVLEIKGTKVNFFNQDGLKQLAGWVHDGAEEDGIDYKGIFVGNSCAGVPPAERPNPFPDSWIKTARLRKFAALRSEDLYTILLAVQSGRLSTDIFWKHVFNTNGLVDVGSILMNAADVCAG